MKPITRRNFIRTAAIATVATRIATRAGAAGSAPAAALAIKPSAPGAAPVRWLDGVAPAVNPGATFGVSWPRGKHAAGTAFSLTTADGAAVPVQTWPLATWPDGSLKWTAHATPADAPTAPHYEVAPGTPAAPSQPLSAVDGADAIEIDTGVIQCRVAKSGRVLVASINRDGKTIASNGRLMCKVEDRSEPGVTRVVPFEGALDKVSLESSGPVRAVVKLEGRHALVDASRSWLPFVVRLYFYAGSEAVRVMHTIVFDGDERKDFIRGLGIRFDVPMRGALHDRHVRFSGQDEGLFGEAVRGLTGLRRDPGRAVKDAQVAGEATPPVDTWPTNVSERLQYIPSYDDWTLLQSGADGFDIRKRTKKGYTWLVAAQGKRAGGLGYVGTPDGGLAFGIRNFWQSHPAQLDIRGATGDTAQVTAWVWAPGAAAMDLRSYHDGMGQDTYAKQYNGGLEITYEDYEPGFDSPEGVARTSELYLFAVAATPSRARLVQLAGVVRTPPALVATAEHLHECGVFGGMWSPSDRSNAARAKIEDRLAWQFDFYRDQQEQRRWYGYWNYGDVMHTYDADRHEWRYDIGGFAWDNSELSTDIWLWLYYLGTGRADVFRFAEAMTRHTGEVDVHHIGRFAPLGSRHNVLHWGCSAKQLRISTAVNRRYYYFLTGDERVGDLMREQLEAARALVRIPPGRKLFDATVRGDLAREAPSDPDYAGLGFGTDWGSIAGAWLTEWERTGDPKMRERLLNSMESIAEQPRGFFSASAPMNLETGRFRKVDNDRVAISHLSAVFGLPEVCAELIELLDVPGFRKAWLDYCELYNASPELQTERLGAPLRGNGLTQGHSRLTAYAAKLLGDPALAARAWKEFALDWRGRPMSPARFASTLVEGPSVLRPVDEAVAVSTNDAAQWGLAAIQCLALAGDAVPDSA